MPWAPLDFGWLSARFDWRLIKRAKLSAVAMQKGLTGGSEIEKMKIGVLRTPVVGQSALTFGQTTFEVREKTHNLVEARAAIALWDLPTLSLGQNLFCFEARRQIR